MVEIRACMYDREANKVKVNDKVFAKMVVDMSAKQRQVVFQGHNFKTAYGTTLPEKTEAVGERIYCHMLVPTRVTKWLDRGKIFTVVAFVNRELMTPQEAGIVIPKEPLPGGGAPATGLVPSLAADPVAQAGLVLPSPEATTVTPPPMEPFDEGEA
jgi:hypothetical protein